MSQRLQSIFFFLSALLFALLFFMPLAEYFGELNILRFSVYGVESMMPNGDVPFKTSFSLPVLILTITVILLGGYLAMGLFRAVKLPQFVKLFKLALVRVQERCCFGLYHSDVFSHTVKTFSFYFYSTHTLGSCIRITFNADTIVFPSDMNPFFA